MSENWDVIIIGAGPSGTTCAKKLVENGFSVKIYDRRQEIGSPKRCGEGLSESIQNLIGKIPDRCIAQKIKGARVYAPNGKYLEAVLERGGFILERKVFDKWLAERAVKAGVEIQSNSFISSLIKHDGYFAGVKGEFLGEEFEEKAKMIVCATGAESPLRKQALGIFSKLDLIDSCLQYEMSGIDIDPDFIHIYVGNEIAPRGYIWVFPKGINRANIGVGIIPGEKTPKFYLEKFVNSQLEIKKGSIIEVNAGCVPVGGMEKDMVTNGLLACGEAAHHVNPIHGGGIKEAVISGKLAADVISESLKKGDVSKKALSKFNKLWWEKRGNRLEKVEKLREVLEKLSDKDLNDLADALKAQDIIEFTRGSKLSILAKVLMKKPKLIGLAKYLL
ncbi:MAG: geranylgeranyl reductase family protein [Candidatus Aenigmarchaeota archaeon]|nr:geranylgeranyl reductase family protein [Candidatus Aenigmarchaeota archaeon]